MIGLGRIRVRFCSCIVSVLFCLNMQWVHAASIEVVEGQPDTVGSERVYSTQTTSHRAGSSADRDSSAALFVKVQELEAEVRDLRGLLEQQAYLIDQLSQRRMDDYLDLDRRIGELQQTGAASTRQSSKTNSVSNSSKRVSTASVSQAPVKPVSVPAVARTTVSPPAADQAKTAYRAAYQKVKDREFDTAKVSLTAFVGDYPESHYVPNAHFWLGELYYLDSDLEGSRKAFYALVTDYSNHRKVADAKFKLGKIYHQMGESNKARSMLQSVLSDHPDSKAANPAREYLKNSLN